MYEDLPKSVRHIRRIVLGPALKKALEEEDNKATPIGERFQDAGENKVKPRTLKVRKKKYYLRF